MIQIEGLNEVIADLTDAPERARNKARKIVQRGCSNIKTDAQQFASGLRHAPFYPSSITYETQETPWGATGEVGPDKNRPQGALGNILEYGTSKNAPFAHLGPALDLEGPRFIEALKDAAADVL